MGLAGASPSCACTGDKSSAGMATAKASTASAANASLLNFRLVMSQDLRKLSESSDLRVLVFYEDAKVPPIGGVIAFGVVPYYSPGIQ